jgi:hypothetical protein
VILVKWEYFGGIFVMYLYVPEKVTLSGIKRGMYGQWICTKIESVSCIQEIVREKARRAGLFSITDFPPYGFPVNTQLAFFLFNSLWPLAFPQDKISFIIYI